MSQDAISIGGNKISFLTNDGKVTTYTSVDKIITLTNHSYNDTLEFFGDYSDVSASIVPDGVVTLTFTSKDSSDDVKIVLEDTHSYRDIKNMTIADVTKIDSSVKGLLGLLGITNVNLSAIQKPTTSDYNIFIVDDFKINSNDIPSTKNISTVTPKDISVGSFNSEMEYIANTDTSLYQNITLNSGWNVTGTKNADLYMYKIGGEQKGVTINGLSAEDTLMVNVSPNLAVNYDKSNNNIKLGSDIFINIDETPIESIYNMQVEFSNVLSTKMAPLGKWLGLSTFQWGTGTYIFGGSDVVSISTASFVERNKVSGKDYIEVTISTDDGGLRASFSEFDGAVDIKSLPESNTTLIGEVSKYIINGDEVCISGGSVNVDIDSNGLIDISDIDNGESVTITADNDGVTIYSAAGDVLTREIISSGTSTFSAINSYKSENTSIKVMSFEEYTKPDWYIPIGEDSILIIDSLTDGLTFGTNTDICVSDSFIASLSKSDAEKGIYKLENLSKNSSSMTISLSGGVIKVDSKDFNIGSDGKISGIDKFTLESGSVSFDDDIKFLTIDDKTYEINDNKIIETRENGIKYIYDLNGFISLDNFSDSNNWQAGKISQPIERLKAYLRIDTDYEDGLLQEFLDTAEAYLKGAISNYDEKYRYSIFAKKAELLQCVIAAELYQNRDSRNDPRKDFSFAIRSMMTQLQYYAVDSDVAVVEVPP